MQSYAVWLSVLILLLSLQAEVTESRCTNSDPCTRDCYTCSHLEKVPDPDSCHRYYVCDGRGHVEVDMPFDCPDDKPVFDIKVRECSSTATCPDCYGPKSCSYDCSIDSYPATISSPTACDLYYQCDSVSLRPGLPQQCPPEIPYYDGAKCQSDVSKCCTCKPFCNHGYLGLVTDPVDCRKYHYCTGDGMPESDGTCPQGQNFDGTALACSPNAKCNPACKNVIGDDGCIDLFMCEEIGVFAKCPGKCMAQYYSCEEKIDSYIAPTVCPNGMVFDPDGSECIAKEDCQYPTS